ncbi:13210_t:CDS:2, partial [Racocetra persica]
IQYEALQDQYDDLKKELNEEKEKIQELQEKLNIKESCINELAKQEKNEFIVDDNEYDCLTNWKIDEKKEINDSTKNFNSYSYLIDNKKFDEIGYFDFD